MECITPSMPIEEVRKECRSILRYLELENPLPEGALYASACQLLSYCQELHDQRRSILRCLELENPLPEGFPSLGSCLSDGS